MEVSLIAMIGIVKKNAIGCAIGRAAMKALNAEDAICKARLQRSRPIMMTTLCAWMGVLPIALGIGAGAEQRQPLGVSIVGGLLRYQLITLFITPVPYLWFDAVGASRTQSKPISAMSLQS